jgi:hypothetical protein
MIRSTVRILTVLTVVLLSGCAIPVLVSVGLGATSVAVNETTGKTTTDHVVSAVNGQDCRLSRMNKEDICQDEVTKFQFNVTTTKITPYSVVEIESRYK